MGFGDNTKGQHSWTLNENDSEKIIKYALEKGINFFDTAIAYQNGTSEQFLGRVLKKYTEREKVVIAKKFLEEPYIPHKLVGVMAENIKK